MENDRNVSYEEVLPTDKFAIQDMFLMRVHRMGVVYQSIMRGWYNGHSYDARAHIEFYAMADEFFMFARSNIEKHLTNKEVAELEGYFLAREKMDPMIARRIYQLFQKFATKSKLTELSEKRFLGSFAYARRELGISTRRRSDP